MTSPQKTPLIGVDPGLSGAIAVLDEETRVYDMPTFGYSRTGFVKRAVDLYEVSVLLDAPRASVYIERVTARPMQGVASMFSLGMSYWGVAGVAHGLLLTVRTVEPRAWKAHFKLGHDKDESLEVARLLFPTLAHQLKAKKHHGRAEALLIARYGQDITEGAR